jgi:hypothetical protein
MVGIPYDEKGKVLIEEIILNEGICFDGKLI